MMEEGVEEERLRQRSGKLPIAMKEGVGEGEVEREKKRIRRRQ